jgi:RimJ/RimL family protein N-acetyltransferase
MQEEWLTERLRARAPGPDDQDGYLSLFLDPAVGDWLRPPPLDPFAEGEILEMLVEDEWHWAEHGFGPWALIDREAGAIVGRGGLRWTDLDGTRAVELPWTVGSGHWNRGLATEAAAAAVEWARSLQLPEVIALIAPDNARSRRVAEKVGLRPGGDTTHAGLPHLVYRRALETAT